MNMTMGCRGRMVGEDGGLQTASRRRGSSLRSPVYSLSLVFCLLVLLSGCDKAAVEQAQQEAREAKADVQRLKHSLALAEKALTEARAELEAVKQDRDEIQKQVQEAGDERDQALDMAQKAQEVALARSGVQTSATASLRQQVAELTALVAKQQDEIDQLKSGEVGDPGDPGETGEPVPLPDEIPPEEPNEG